MALLIYKQRHEPPNRKSTPVANARYLEYIATREGVMALSNADNGLFGSINNEMAKALELETALSHINKESRARKTIFKSIISFKKFQAESKGLVDRDSWIKYIKH